MSFPYSIYGKGINTLCGQRVHTSVSLYAHVLPAGGVSVRMHACHDVDDDDVDDHDDDHDDDQNP